VYGVATPTADGIRAVLARVGAGKDGQGRRVVWHNMREEATVYQGQALCAARSPAPLQEHEGVHGKQGMALPWSSILMLEVVSVTWLLGSQMLGSRFCYFWGLFAKFAKRNPTKRSICTQT